MIDGSRGNFSSRVPQQINRKSYMIALRVTSDDRPRMTSNNFSRAIYLRNGALTQQY